MGAFDCSILCTRFEREAGGGSKQRLQYSGGLDGSGPMAAKQQNKEVDVITGKLIDRNVKLTRLLCLPQGASSSKKLLLVAILAMAAVFTACGDAHLPLLTSIQVSPANSTLDIGQTQQFTAVGTFSDGNTRDLTNLVTWSSSNTTVAAISSSGLALSHGQGSSMISANFNTADGLVTGATTLNVVVTLKSLTITPVNSSIANSTSLQLTAAGVFSDGSTHDLTASVTWTSSSAAIATVSSGGVVTGTGVGSATIAATQAGVSASTTVTVTAATLTAITITPPNSAIASGTSKQLIATGNFSDGTTQNLTAFVTWTSSNPSVAAVSNAADSQGLVTGSGLGHATITATYGGVSGSTLMVVTSATLTGITITPPDPSIAKGTSRQLIATGDFSDGTTQNLTAFVTWTSSNQSLAAVSNAVGSRGLVTGTGVGNATVTATLGGVSGSTGVTTTPPTLTSIDIAPPNFSLAKGTSLQLTAIGNFSDGTTEDLTTSVTWTSSAPEIAVVSNAAGKQGLITGTLVGSATIAAMQAGVSGSTTVTVTPATLTSIVVTPANASIALGTTVPLTATGTFSDGTTQDFTASASWISTSDAIATVGNTGSPGLVTGTGVGSATITATQAGVSGSATVTVTPATLISIAVTPLDPSIAAGTQEHLTATGTFSDNTIQNLTASASWTSSSIAVAMVGSMGSQGGIVTGIAPGTATIQATQDGVMGSATVTVTTPEFAYVTDDKNNTVSAFEVNPSTGALTAIAGPPFPNPGRASAAVTADPSGRFLYTTNDSSDDVTAYNIVQSGANSGALNLIGTVVSGGSAPFGIAVEPRGHFAYVGNQGSNTVSGFAIDASTGALTPISGSPFSAAMTPSGVAVHPNDHFIYVANFIPSQVSLYSFSSTTGALSSPRLSPAPNLPQSVALDPMGRFAYTANILGGGTVSAYTVDSGTGALTLVETVIAGNMGGGPASVAVDPSGRFVYVAGGSQVAGFTIDQIGGTLTLVPGSPFPTGMNTKWVTVNPNGRFVYVANHDSGGVSAYTIELPTGALRQIPGSPFPLPTGPLGPAGPSSITVVAVP